MRVSSALQHKEPCSMSMWTIERRASRDGGRSATTIFLSRSCSQAPREIASRLSILDRTNYTRTRVRLNGHLESAIAV